MLPGPAGAMTNVVARFDRGAGQLRVDGPYDGRFYAIVDINAARMFMVTPDQHLYAEQQADPNIMALLQPGNADLRRPGGEMVAGLPCTDYDATMNDRAGRVCLTDDGVLLRATIADPERRPYLEAVRVTYGRQPRWIFGMPVGFQRLDLPNLLYGLNMGPLGGSPPGGYRGLR